MGWGEMKAHGLGLISICMFMLIRCVDEQVVTDPRDDDEADYVLLTDRTSRYTLRVTLIDSMVFLEHPYSVKHQRASRSVIGTRNNTGNIYVSEDLGSSFRVVFSDNSARWQRCFTTESNRHILWDSASGRLWLFDPDWNLLKQTKAGSYVWLGNWSIGEYNGTIIYAEYAIYVDRLSVWRSADDGETWQIVLTKNGRYSADPEIRHFHLVQPDPYCPGTWYLASGDSPEESKVWKSENNGLRWIDVTDPNPNGAKTLDVHRMTATYFDENYIYWGTDDLMDGNAKFVRSARTEPLDIQALDNIGNLIRALVATPCGLVFISEAKVMTGATLMDLTIHISADKCNALELVRLSGFNDSPTGFCYSRASLASRDGVFFSYFDGSRIFLGKPGILKWEISETDPYGYIVTPVEQYYP